MIRMLATRYRLPYRVEYEPTLSLELGSDLFVEVTAQSTLVPDAIDRYDDFLFQLCVLSSSGALGGDTVAPWDCGTSMAELHMATGNRACWRLKDWKTDNRAMLVLAHAFLASQDAFPITRLGRHGAEPRTSNGVFLMSTTVPLQV